MKNAKKLKTTADNLEERFETGEEVLDYFDVAKAERPGWRRFAPMWISRCGWSDDWTRWRRDWE